IQLPVQSDVIHGEPHATGCTKEVNVRSIRVADVDDANRPGAIEGDGAASGDVESEVRGRARAVGNIASEPFGHVTPIAVRIGIPRTVRGQTLAGSERKRCEGYEQEFSMPVSHELAQLRAKPMHTNEQTPSQGHTGHSRRFWH